jgi:predicted ATPase
MGFFQKHCQRQGIFIFDEPESALSPSRQIEFLKLLHAMERFGICLAIMATHAPLLIAYPKARLLELTPAGLAPIARARHGAFLDAQGVLARPGGVCGEVLGEGDGA